MRVALTGVCGTDKGGERDVVAEANWWERPYTGRTGGVACADPA